MFVAPRLVLRLGFGDEYAAGADALPLLGLAMTTLALTYLAVNFLLAIGSHQFLAPLALVAVAEPVLLLAGGVERLRSVAAVVLAVQLTAAAAVLVPSLRRS